MSHVDIAMATYNGESYIEEQILSIINQTYSSWTLYISDDASTDKTLDIINKYEKIDPRIKLINTERQGGVVNNFNCALSATRANYVLLADQDDYWNHDRVEKLFSYISARDTFDKPLMVFSDLEIVDDKLVTISESFYKSNSIDPLKNLNPVQLLWKCSVYGCTTILNRRLLDKCLPIPAGITMHDNWLALNAATENGLEYLDVRTIRYRQHSNNVVGGGNKGFIKKLLSLNKNITKMIKYRGSINTLLDEAKNIPSNDILQGVDIKGKKSVDFAFKEIFPAIFFQSKKAYSILIFIIFMVKR
ncbi:MULTISPECIES: glycosyltransferase family 2 protein [Rahnella]|uniref:glycosyltransferase family 2 protein n=1 Tax=Rahnella TaxID=34037 RepID=UPI001C276D1D|nr:glycosyltransferase family 2 protein [Rahnella rivi]MBU9830802.1 glycosyltransferase family 2 protein [Rahnella rivi]